MFSKPDKRSQPGKTSIAAPAPSDLGRRSSSSSLKVASLISDDLVIHGGITSEGEVHVDGKVLGDVKVARLTLGETGMVEGSITAETVEIRGKVVGPLTAKLVRLYATAHIDGDITHEQLAMETGAHFQGRSLKLQRPTSAPALAAPSPSVVSLQQPVAASAG